MSVIAAFEALDNVSFTLAATFEPMPGDPADLTVGVVLRAQGRHTPDAEAALFDFVSSDADHLQITGKASFVLRIDPFQLAAVRGAGHRNSALVQIIGLRAGSAPFGLGQFRLDVTQGLLR